MTTLAAEIQYTKNEVTFPFNVVISFLLGSNLIETFDVSFFKTRYPSSSAVYFNYRFFAVFPKLTEGRGMGQEEEGHFIKVSGNTRY